MVFKSYFPNFVHITLPQNISILCIARSIHPPANPFCQLLFAFPQKNVCGNMSAHILELYLNIQIRKLLQWYAIHHADPINPDTEGVDLASIFSDHVLQALSAPGLSHIRLDTFFHLRFYHWKLIGIPKQFLICGFISP